MKRRCSVLPALVTALALCACGSGGETEFSPAESGSAVSDASLSSAPPQAAKAGTEAAASASGADGVDIDLTALSSTMVYSQVYDMLYFSPESYRGKTVKMRGSFEAYQWVDKDGQPVKDKVSTACVVADATACCAEGIEFVCWDGSVYPQDYPEIGTEITVTGTFQIDEEEGFTWYYLADAEMNRG